MMKRIWVAAIGAVGLAVLGLAVAQAGISDIYGTAHDVGTAGTPTCLVCHTPHKAQGAYLFARTPKEDLEGLAALCFSCHDGSETPVGAFILDAGVVNHKVAAGVEGEDCDRCHDPHVSNWKFVTDEATFKNANLCEACHPGRTGDFSHPLANTDKPKDRTWSPYASPPDFSGTRLFNEAGDAEVLTGGAGAIRCATCHVPHGAVGQGLTSMPYSSADGKHSPLCDNCHY